MLLPGGPAGLYGTPARARGTPPPSPSWSDLSAGGAAAARRNGRMRNMVMFAPSLISDDATTMQPTDRPTDDASNVKRFAAFSRRRTPARLPAPALRKTVLEEGRKTLSGFA